MGKMLSSGLIALYARLLVIRKKRGFSIKELLQYSLGPIAWCLATSEGNTFKSVKSKLQNALEEKMSLVDSVSQNCTRVFDGMRIVQQLLSGLEIFGCLPDFVLTCISNNPSSNISSPRINTGMPQSNRVREIDELPVVVLE